MDKDLINSEEKLLNTINAAEFEKAKVALIELVHASRAYRQSVSQMEVQLDKLTGVNVDLQKSCMNLIETLRNISVILNADRENALKVKGMDVILTALAKFTLQTQGMNNG